MTAEQLLRPRFEVIADYPKSMYKLGEIIDHGSDEIYIGLDTKYTDYPKIFRKLNWWEKRKKEEMPKRLISLSQKDEEGFSIEKQEVYEIIDWDMRAMNGIIDNEKRQICSLLSWKPEYGYIPVN